MTVNAHEIADALGLPRPTPQQVRVIESDPRTPTLVIAGAGSGKTETMANRVLWLVANKLVQPSEVLGLTFTRKAAGELDERITKRLDQLVAHGLASARGDDLLDQPTVSTYNSFASSIVSERSLLVGREPDSTVIDESTAWRLARQTVVASEDTRLVSLDRSVGRITDAVLHLERAMRENLCTAEQILDIATEFERLLDLPISETGSKKTPYASVVTAVGEVSALHPLVALAERYTEEKRRRGFLEFSDQVALALEVCRRSKATVSDYRARHRVILLDEYQDTSVVQTWLLAELFANHGVMAVGDPHQSIYGWRGASSDNLNTFSTQFARGNSRILSLSTSWRNSRAVLDVANHLVTPLTQKSRVPVETLSARPEAPAGLVQTVYPETIEDEATAVARWMADQIARATPQSPVSGAVICRNRSIMSQFSDALTREGVPNRILGLGGLLSSPEVVDIVSMLRTVWFTDANSALIRTLSGPRWRIGVSDLAALHSAARWLVAHDWKLTPLSAEQQRIRRESLAPEDSASLIDALDAVAAATDDKHEMLRGFSREGLRRIREAGEVIATIRSRTSLSIADLVRIVEVELRLDTEVMAVTGHVGATGVDVKEAQKHARRNLDALYDVIANFVATNEDSTLPSFLSWLDHAERQDSFAARPEAPDPNAVQLITAHGAKGLEWDVVAVPRLCEGDFPSPSRSGAGWLRIGQLPDELKGDAASLPSLPWREVHTQKEFNDLLTEYKNQARERQEGEERRLIYVATTRARERLLLSGSFWAEQTRPRSPSRFLTELVQAGLVAEVPESSEYRENPLNSTQASFEWPGDPLGSRRPVVEDASAMVTQLRDSLSAEQLMRLITPDIRNDLILLLEERQRENTRGEGALLPQRITASGFKDFISNPDEIVRRMRRPVPQKPFAQTRLGTQFHEWVEQRYATPRGSAIPLLDDVFSPFIDPEHDIDGEASGAADGSHEGGSITLAQLQATFEASEWGDRQPVEVEREIHIPFAGRTLVCKIDAVYSQNIEGVEHFEIVDWKTGRAPRTEAEIAERQLQLALYRVAYATWKNIELDRVSVALYYVAENTIIRPTSLPSLEQMESIWFAAVSSQNQM
ncbi:ATP-dependent DNA helicase [Lysinibacter sp. HNR]|uniref:ATP-dependent DNA helicase n=1 Tax=Lysinibacter sp. HNR TaxID=3031408 RepID=UPI002434C500|nr:ATP-dependent DNA helicase [Lysinibacter sp. HNR]WGD36383.1 ATP-dependent DNA helicase [Lysinibacter sp. HNR]